jgi:hypothetical protein
MARGSWRVCRLPRPRQQRSGAFGFHARLRARGVELLRQPGGFEGLGASFKALRSDDPAIDECEKRANVALDRNAAGRPHADNTTINHHLISARIDDLVHAGFIVAERGPKARSPFTNPFVTDVWPRLGRGGVVDEDNVRIEQLEELGASRLVELPNDLDVLPRHRLLRQPGGFEGCLNLGSAEAERLDPDDLPIADLPRTEEAIVDPSIAFRHPTRKTTQRDDLVAAVEEAVDLETGVEQNVPLRPPDSGNFGDTAPRSRLDRRRGVDELDSGICVGDKGVDVAAVPSVQSAAHDLHVLLRHRPLSIAPGSCCG